ncbi:MAG: hypothetical protein Q9218_005917 [Villophora microphyllina]
MRLFLRAQLSAAWLIVCSIHTYAQNIGTSFDVQGDCNNAQRALLDTFVTETLDLADTALAGIGNFDNDEIIRENLLTYFGAKKTKANQPINTVRNVLDDVQNFLRGNRAAFGGNKPRLYCSSKWWQQRQPSDAAQDINGQPIPDQTIRDLFPTQLGVINGKQQYAYWSDDYKTYLITDDQHGQFYCDQTDNLAVTDDSSNVDPHALILCPSSFQLQVGTHPPRTNALGSTRPTDGQNLNDLQPRTLTFFHEVIHVVRGNQNTQRVGKNPLEYYGCPMALEAGSKDAAYSRKNPDNYVFFTLSYWFWQHRKYADDGSLMDPAGSDRGTKYNFPDCRANPETVPP